MGTVMRDDTSQHPHRLAATQPVRPIATTTWSPRIAGRVRARLTPSSERETMSKSRIEWMRIMRHHDRLPSNRTAVNAAGASPVHPPQHLHTSCRSLGPLTARADRPVPAAFASGIRVAAGYLWHRLSPRSFTGRCNGPRYPAPEPRRPVASLQAALHDSGTSWGASKHPGGVPGAHEMRVILKEPHPRAACTR